MAIHDMTKQLKRKLVDVMRKEYLSYEDVHSLIKLGLDEQGYINIVKQERFVKGSCFNRTVLLVERDRWYNLLNIVNFQDCRDYAGVNYVVRQVHEHFETNKIKGYDSNYFSFFDEAFKHLLLVVNRPVESDGWRDVSIVNEELVIDTISKYITYTKNYRLPNYLRQTIVQLFKALGGEPYDLLYNYRHREPVLRDLKELSKTHKDKYVRKVLVRYISNKGGLYA